jgi:hypothetical protein
MHGTRDHRPGERKYPEMPEREEQEYLRMLAEDPWADETEIYFRLDRGHR